MGITFSDPDVNSDEHTVQIAALTPTDNGVIIGNGTAWTVESGSTFRASVGLAIGTDVQAYDADLAAWAGVNPSSYLTTAAAALAYQPLDADLTAWAGVNPSSYLTTAIAASTYQPLDSDLTALAALAANGIVTRTATGTITVRTITGPAAGISVSNGDGVSGNPTLALANDLAAVEGLSSNGMAARTATDTWAVRTITGTANELTVTNGDGVSGNPTLSIPAALTFTGKTITGGTFASPTLSGTVAFGTSTLSGTPRFNSAGVLYFDGHGSNDTTYMGSIRGSSGSPYDYLDIIANGGSGGWMGGIRFYTNNGGGANSLMMSLLNNGGTPYTTIDNGGFVVGAPTGGSKGTGTVNATAVYDDNSLLTCYIVEAWKYGEIDLNKWDDLVPNREHPAQYQTVETGETDDDGKPITEQRLAKEAWTEVREHAPARGFAKVAADRLDIDKFAKFVWDNERLPAFPAPDRWRDMYAGNLSAGDLIQRLWETVEVMAVHSIEARKRELALIARVEALEAAQ